MLYFKAKSHPIVYASTTDIYFFRRESFTQVKWRACSLSQRISLAMSYHMSFYKLLDLIKAKSQKRFWSCLYYGKLFYKFFGIGEVEPHKLSCALSLSCFHSSFNPHPITQYLDQLQKRLGNLNPTCLNSKH